MKRQCPELGCVEMIPKYRKLCEWHRKQHAIESAKKLLVSHKKDNFNKVDKIEIKQSSGQGDEVGAWKVLEAMVQAEWRFCR